MSKEAVLKIKEAEAQAADIVESAYITSKKMIADAEATSRILCEEYEAAVRADYLQSVEEIRKSANEIVEKNASEDEKKFQTALSLSEKNINDAVKLILQGVSSECQ